MAVPDAVPARLFYCPDGKKKYSLKNTARHKNRRFSDSIFTQITREANLPETFCNGATRHTKNSGAEENRRPNPVRQAIIFATIPGRIFIREKKNFHAQGILFPCGRKFIFLREEFHAPVCRDATGRKHQPRPVRCAAGFFAETRCIASLRAGTAMQKPCGEQIRQKFIIHNLLYRRKI
jgi:hypothetical protein